MPEKSFGIKQLSIIGSGSPQIQVVENLNIRVGVGSTVIIGDKDSDFTSPAPSFVDTNNTTVLNVGVVTANRIFGEFLGTIGGDVNIDTADKADKIKVLEDDADATRYLTFVDAKSGHEDLYVNDKITWNSNHYNISPAAAGSGKLTIKGDIGIAGTISYEDVTNVDSLGIITGRLGLHLLENGLDVRSGVSTFKDGVETVSIGSTINHLNLSKGYCVAGGFTQADENIVFDHLSYWKPPVNLTPKGNYVPRNGELIQFTFSEDGKETRTFIFEYVYNDSSPASGKCSIVSPTNNIHEYNQMSTTAGIWRFAEVATAGGYSTTFKNDAFNYYTRTNTYPETDPSFRIEVGTLVTATNSVGIGTSSLHDPQTTDRGAYLAVAGIVTAYNVYADKFYGPVEGELTPTGNVAINGNLTVSGNTTLGDATGDDITLTGRLASSIVPKTDDSYDLGISGKEWKDLYIDGTANIDSLVADTADIDGGTIDGTTIGGNTAAVGSFTNLNASGTSTLDEIYTNSIYSKDVSSLTLIGDKEIFLVRRFSQVLSNTNTNTFHNGIAEQTGGYTAYDGEILTFEFSETGKETRVFQFKYSSTYDYDAPEKCSSGTTDGVDYGSATHFRFSKVAYGGYSTDWDNDGRSYYSVSSYNFRIRLIPKITAAYSVGIGTTNPINVPNQGAVLGVAGIVTAHEMYAEKITATEYFGTFKGTIDTDGSSGTIENANKINIQQINTGDQFQIPFASNVLMPGYKDLYIDTDGTQLRYYPAKNKLSVQDLSLGGDLEVTGISTFTEGAVVTGIGVSIHEGGLNVTSGISTFNDNIQGVSIGATAGSGLFRIQENGTANICIAGDFNTKTSSGTWSYVVYAAPQFGPIGSYIKPAANELITFTFSQDGKETKSFTFKYTSNEGQVPQSGECQILSTDDNFNKITTSSGNWSLSYTSISGISNDFYNAVVLTGQYDHTNSSFRIQVGRVASINSAVGIGTSNPLDLQSTDRGAVLAVAGIVTASKFYGPIEGALTPTGDVDIEEWIRHIGDTNTKFGFPLDSTFSVYTNNNERFRINDVGITSIQGSDDQDNFIINVDRTEFAIHTDSTDGEVSLRAQDGGGPATQNSKYMSFYTQYTGTAVAERMRITANGALVVAGESAFSDGTFGEAKLQFNSKSGNHIGACSLADTNASITHVLFRNKEADGTARNVGSVGTHDADLVIFTGNNAAALRITDTGALGFPNDNANADGYGTSGQVLTSNGDASPSWQDASGGSGASSVNVAAVTPDDNTYHLTFVSGTSGAQNVKVSVGATIRNNSLYANHLTARSNATQESLMNQASIHSDGGLELRRDYQVNTSGGPYIDFTKNRFKYPDFTTISINTGDDTFTTSTNIIQREWITSSTAIAIGDNYISGATHGLSDGDPVRYVKSVKASDGTAGTLIGGITPGRTYYAVRGTGSGNNTTAFRLSETEADAKSVSPTIIDITSVTEGDNHTFRLGTLNTGDVLSYKGGYNGGANINGTNWPNVDNFVFIVQNGASLNTFKIATSVYNALDGTVSAITSGAAEQMFGVDTDDFDARIQLDSLETDDASILFRTPVPGTSLPSSVGKSQVRLQVTREGAVVSGIATVAYNSNRLDGTQNYIQAGIGTHFIREADSPDELVLTRDYRSKMIVFAKDINASDTKTVRINHGVFGYGDSITFYNASDHVCTINANGPNARIYLAGTNVYVAAGYGTPGNTGKVFLSSHSMATLTFAYNDGTVDEFVITGGGVYV